MASLKASSAIAASPSERSSSAQTRLDTSSSFRLAPEHAESNLETLKRDLRVLDGKIANLTAAVERGGALDALVAQLHDRQQERERLLATMAAARTLDQLLLDRAAIEATVHTEVARWRTLLSSESVEDGRTLLREVLNTPLVFTPEAKGYHFRGRVATGELIAGAVNGDACPS